MLITNHTLAGSIIGATAPNIASAAVFGFASHFVLDAVPHWGTSDRTTYLRIARIDGIVGLGVLGVCVARAPNAQRGRVLVGALAACAPDIDKPAQHFLNRQGVPGWFQHIHQCIQRESPKRLAQEPAVAALLAATFVTVLHLKRRKNRKRAHAPATTT